MLNNQYNSKYLNIKKIVKDDGTVVFLEKDHLNSVEDVVLFQDKVIGQRTETAGTPLLTIVEHIATDATTSTCAINNIKVNGIAQVPDSSKTVNVEVPQTLGDLAEDVGHKHVTQDEKTYWGNKQEQLVFEGGNYDPATNKVLCKSDIAAFTGATRFRGKVEHAYDIDDPKNGDIIIMGTKEYIYCDECDPVWSEIGDESTHAVKGSIVNSDIASDAAIAQSKVAGLVDVLDGKVDVESGKSLVDDTEIEKIHEHDNKTTLDAITSDAWNGLVEGVNAVSGKADKTTKVAGKTLAADITVSDLKEALDIHAIPTDITTCVTGTGTNAYYDVFCNGIPVVVERGSSDDQVVVYYDNKQKNVTVDKGTYKGIRIYGGCNDLGFKTYLPATSVTFNSGKITSLYAASVNSGEVGSANLMINGGTISGGISGGRSDGPVATKFHDNVVGDLRVIVNNCDYLLTVYGSSNGYSTVGHSYVEINGGTQIDYAVPAAPNGVHGDCEMVVNGGTIGTLANVARGMCTKSKITVNGGSVQTLYIGGEESDKSSYYNCELHLNGGHINNTVAGYNWMVSETQPDISKVNGTYVEGILTEDGADVLSKLTLVEDFTAWKNGTAVNAGKDSEATNEGVALGKNSSATVSGLALGNYAASSNYGVSIGVNAQSNLSVAIGADAFAGSNSVALGRYAQSTGKCSVQINGTSPDDSANYPTKNTEDYTLKFFAGSDNGNVTIVKNGKIPTESLEFNPDTKVNVVSGKGLSTNDYTTAEKNKLASEVELVFTLSDNSTKTFKLVGSEVTVS